MCNLFVDAFEVRMAPGVLIIVSLKGGYLGVTLWASVLEAGHHQKGVWRSEFCAVYK